jgi:hypothetical protein
MGCCSLKKESPKRSKIEFFLRLSVFKIFHTVMMTILFLISIFSQNHKKIYRFYRNFYNKALDELK